MEIERWLEEAFAGRSTREAAAAFLPAPVVEQFGIDFILEGLVKAAAGRPLVSLRRAPLDTIITATFEPAGAAEAEALECVLDGDGRLLGIQPVPLGLDITVVASDALPAPQRARLRGLFEVAYDQADPQYLDKSLTKLRWVAIASSGDDVVGFSLGDLRQLDLPLVGPTPVLLAGRACVDPAHRRHGLFRYLSNLSLRAGGVAPPGPMLAAGRMAHPASMRVFLAAPTLVPRPGRRPSELQQAIGQIVAEAYGVVSFDPETFVCRGSGHPIGFPRMVQEVEPEEWDVFEPVDRSRGDSLLALIWHGEAPDGW